MTKRDTKQEGFGTSEPQAGRLEELWAGEFGDAYSRRNAQAGEGREVFWRSLLQPLEVRSVLEVGCNVGANLRWIQELVPPPGVFGVDINETALAEIRRTLPKINAVYASARSLPFRDASFDLVFTVGVLIHLPPSILPLAMGEVVRCSRQYVLCCEYFAEEPTEVPYRGERGALFKRDFGALYQELFPELRLVRKGFLGRDEGWDDVTWWLFKL